MSTAVQPIGWASALPRRQYAELKQVNINDDWFDVYEVFEDIYALYEPGNFQEVISYLILGNNRAMLFDTGMGIGDIKAVVTKLTELPIFVVNSHSHFDHIGGNHRFEEGYILDTDPSRFRMENGLKHEDVLCHISGDSNARALPQGFNPDEYEIKPCPQWRYIQDGTVFDLGGKTFVVYSTPGHSPDSICMEYKEGKILFTGDTFYPATLYAHIKYDDGMNSEFETYRKTMRDLSDRFSQYTLLTSHNEPIREGSELTKVADAFDLIKDNKVDFETDEEGLKKYTFDTFCIVTN